MRTMGGIVAVLSGKGGSGKTTVCRQLGRSLQLAGESVVLVDTDTQRTLMGWRRVQERVGVQPLTDVVVATSIDQVARLPQLRGRFDWIVVDGIPRATDMLAATASVADLIIVPLQPTIDDAWPAVDTVDVARAKCGDGVPIVFFVTRQKKGTHLARDIDETLAGVAGATVMLSRFTDTVAVPYSHAAGVCVLEYEPNGVAADELRSLTAEVRSLTNRKDHE